ncbi:hypothetical protein CMV_006420 [Castanea mollissima]|uniref:Dol-P-Glc:Glc(2)Man(9)GlcNAc(2)-PP-Dol alpha-1,2-glucosyltransferase n=1 Tax=Castanea mollissima TaxID=60419 RepID=A0A8J4W3K9_9ROSI|nr:hypothetical protein CMV_006420 [Castanea mollissima]
MGKVAVAVIVSLWIISVSILVNRIVPEPYMDEIFHNSGATVLHWQFQKLGSHDYHPSWPVGSCVSVVLLPGWSKGPCIGTIFHLSMFIVPAALSFSEVCTTAFLRTVNGVLAVLCSIIVCCIAYCSACYVSCMLEEELLVHCSVTSAVLQVCLMKLSFVHWNGSVVLGAKEAHAVSPHFDRSFILEEKAHQFLSNAHCCYCWLLLCTFLQHSPSLSYS